MKNVTVKDAKNRLTELLREAEGSPIVITRHGTPAGAIVGFADTDDFVDWQMLNDPQMRARVTRAYEQLQAGKTISHEEVLAQLMDSGTHGGR